MLCQSTLETIVKNLVKNTSAVRTEKTVDERGTLITLFVDQTDLPLVIGKQGSMAVALRTIARAIGAKENAAVSLRIHEDEVARQAHYAKKAATSPVPMRGQVIGGQEVGIDLAL